MAKLQKAIEVLNAYSEVASPIMDDFFSDDRCINATRVGLDVFRYFGINHFKPLSVHTVAMNAEYAKLHTAHPHPTEEQVQEAAQKGAWSVQIETGQQIRPEGYLGHVVLIGYGYLLDAAVLQFNRPHKHIVVPPILTTHLIDGFAQEKRYLAVKLPEGYIVYMARLKDRAFIHAPGYQRHDGNKEAARRIAMAIEEKLDDKDR